VESSSLIDLPKVSTNWKTTGSRVWVSLITRLKCHKSHRWLGVQMQTNNRLSTWWIMKVVLSPKNSRIVNFNCKTCLKRIMTLHHREKTRHLATLSTARTCRHTSTRWALPSLVKMIIRKQECWRASHATRTCYSAPNTLRLSKASLAKRAHGCRRSWTQAMCPSRIKGRLPRKI